MGGGGGGLKTTMFNVTDEGGPFYFVFAFPYEIVYNAIGFFDHLFACKLHNYWNYNGFNDLDSADNSKVPPPPQLKLSFDGMNDFLEI